MALVRGHRLSRAMPPRALAAWMQDPGIVVRAHLGLLAWLFEREREMREHLAEVRCEASALGHPFSLAFAHAALDHPTPERVATARSHAKAVLPRLSGMRFTLGEARQIVLLVTQLKRVLSVIDSAPAFA